MIVPESEIFGLRLDCTEMLEMLFYGLGAEMPNILGPIGEMLHIFDLKNDRFA